MGLIPMLSEERVEGNNISNKQDDVRADKTENSLRENASYADLVKGKK